MKNYFTLLLISIALLFGACGKEGPEGKQGEQGAQGIPGADGSTLLSGNGAPAASLGKNGDYYLDKTAIMLYGPKTNTGWGSATSLKGTPGANGSNGKDGANGRDGADGKNGSQIFSGTTVPSPSLGSIGDFYFDTQNIVIYGPKTTDGWGTPISLKNNDNGIKTFIYSNQKFTHFQLPVQTQEDLVLKPYYYPAVLRTFFCSKWTGFSNITPPVNNYEDYYEDGLVFAYFRYNGSAWGKEYKTEMVNSYTEQDRISYSLHIYASAITRNGITIIGERYSETMKSTPEMVGDHSEDYIKNTTFDVKIVLVPAGSVTRLSSVDTKDLKAVELALGL